jgi:hypothetical protein
VESLADWCARESFQRDEASIAKKPTEDLTPIERASEDAKAWAIEVENRMKALENAPAEKPEV